VPSLLNITRDRPHTCNRANQGPANVKTGWPVSCANHLIGTPGEVAERMGETMEEIGGDGFLISTPFQRISRRFINEVCEGLVPELQRSGLVRET
jgi:alkanesulfonate monooxygenase SsuD/methylene tetrahydromethanopterin reductase-like flavin-dependent oxidoreductase (luciferase family)